MNRVLFISLCVRFEFTVSLVELHRRTLDVAVKNGGGLLSKHKGLLGKVETFTGLDNKAKRTRLDMKCPEMKTFHSDRILCFSISSFRL